MHQLVQHVAVLVQITVVLAKIAQVVSTVLNKGVVVEFAKSLLRRREDKQQKNIHYKNLFIMNPTNILTIELKTHFLRLYQMALADDDFDILELQMLYHLADERGVPREELDKLFQSPINYLSTIPEDLNTRIEYLYDLTRIMWADGKITEDETNTLKKYCKKFEFLDENIEEITEFFKDCVQKGLNKDEIINQLNS